MGLSSLIVTHKTVVLPALKPNHIYLISLHTIILYTVLAGEPRFELRTLESKSNVIPFHYSPMSLPQVFN